MLGKVLLCAAVLLLVASNAIARVEDRGKEAVSPKGEAKTVSDIQEMVVSIPPIIWEPPVLMTVPRIEDLISGKLKSIKIEPQKGSTRIQVVATGALRSRGIARTGEAQSDENQEQSFVLEQITLSGKPVIRVHLLTYNHATKATSSEQMAVYDSGKQIKNNLQLLISIFRGASEPKVKFHYEN